MATFEEQIAILEEKRKSYNSNYNLFFLLCCCTGIPVFLIIALMYNSKEVECKKEIQIIEEHLQKGKPQNYIQCQQCLNMNKNEFTFCSYCGTKIDIGITTTKTHDDYLPETRIVNKVLNRVDPELEKENKQFGYGFFSIISAIIVIFAVSWAILYIGGPFILSVIFNIIGVAIGATLVKDRKKLGYAGIILNIIAILVVIITTVLCYTIIN